MKRRYDAVIILLSVLVLAGGHFSSAQVLTIRGGATLSLNDNTLDTNCLDTLIESGGTLDLGSGLFLDAGTVTIENGGQMLEASGTVQYCLDMSVTATESGTLVPNNGGYVVAHYLASGASQQTEFTITNNGTETVSLQGNPTITIAGNHPDDVAVITYPTSPIASGGTANFTIEFTAGFTAGMDNTRDATLSFVASDGMNQLTYTFTVVVNPRYLLWTK